MTTAAESRERWVRQGWCTNEVNDVDAAKESIHSVYARFNRPAPQIIWVDSPWQLATVPFLMNLVCLVPPEFQNESNGRAFLEAVREQLDYLDQPLWRQAAQCVKDHLSPGIEQCVRNGRRALYDSTYQRVGAAIDKRLAELKTVDGDNSDFAIPDRQRRTFQLHFQAGTGIDIKRLGGSSECPEKNASEKKVLENSEGQSVEDQLIAEIGDVFVWDLGKFAHPWTKIHIGSQMQEQLREPFREYVGHLLTLESLLATERGTPWQQPVNLDPLPVRRETRCIYPARKSSAPGLAPKFIGPVIEGERFGLAQESANLIAKFNGIDGVHVDNRLSPSQRLFSSDYELLWGNWATEVLALLLDLEGKRENQNAEYGNQNKMSHVMSDDKLQELRDYWNFCNGAFMYVLEPEVVYACKNPTIHVDELGHFHSQDQAAIEFPDGYGFHFVHGTLAQESN